jgi:ribosomal protein L37AE/L43A
MTQGLTCPHCGGQAFTDYGDGLVACQRCYTQFDLNQQQCPQCGSLLAEGIFVCEACGHDLRGDVARQTIEQRLMTPDDVRRARHPVVRQVRAKEEEGSRQRLEAWWDEENKRRAAERQAQLARQSRERRFVVTALIITVVILLTIVLIGLLVLSAEPEPTPTPAAWSIQQAAGTRPRGESSILT